MRNNALGLVAIFIALNGTAIAAQIAGDADSGQPATSAAKKKLKRGPRGPAGPTGPTGPPGPSTGPAGGALSGSYPNPALAANAVGGLSVADGSLGTTEFASSIPAVHATHSSGQAIANTGVAADLSFDSELHDTASMHSTTTENELIHFPVEGIYLITARVWWEDDATGIRRIFLGSSDPGGTSTISADQEAATGFNQTLETSTQIQRGPFNSIFLRVAQTSGDAGLEVIDSELSATWLAPGP